MHRTSQPLQERAEDIIQAMLKDPLHGIEIVLHRLRQKVGLLCECYLPLKRVRIWSGARLSDSGTRSGGKPTKRTTSSPSTTRQSIASTQYHAQCAQGPAFKKNDPLQLKAKAIRERFEELREQHHEVSS